MFKNKTKPDFEGVFLVMQDGVFFAALTHLCCRCRAETPDLVLFDTVTLETEVLGGTLQGH